MNFKNSLCTAFVFAIFFTFTTAYGAMAEATFVTIGEGYIDSLPDEADLCDDDKTEVIFTEPFLLNDISLMGDTYEVERYGRTAINNMKSQKKLSYISAYDKIVKCLENSDRCVDLSKEKITLSELFMLVQTVINDYPGFYYVENRFSYSYNEFDLFMNFPFYKGGEFTQEMYDVIKAQQFWPEYNSETDREKFHKCAEHIILNSGVNNSMSDYEKAKRLHDELADYVTYDYSLSADYIHCAYGAMVNGLAVCDGYARSYQYLLNKVGVECVVVHGTSYNSDTGEKEPHAWNLVKLDDEYYYTDLTWDDQGDNLFYAYFNITEDKLSQDHVISVPEFGLPECKATKCSYFESLGYNISSECEMDKVVKQLSEGEYARFYVEGTNPDNVIEWFVSNSDSIARKLGISGRYSRSYSRLGREVHLYITSIDNPKPKYEMKADKDFSVNVRAPKGNYKLMQAFYDENGALIDIKRIPLNYDMTKTQNLTLSPLENVEGLCGVKYMLVKNVSELKPIGEATEVKY